MERGPCKKLRLQATRLHLGEPQRYRVPTKTLASVCHKLQTGQYRKIDSLSFKLSHFDPDERLMQFQSRFATQVTPIKKNIKILVSNPLK